MVDMGKYSGQATLLGISIFSVYMFSILMIFIWAALVRGNVRRVMNYAFSMYYVGVNSVPSNPEKVGAHCTCRLSRNKFVKPIIFLAVPRILSTVLLDCYGIKFLEYADILKDFILNIVALGFVYDIPGIFYRSFNNIARQRQLTKLVEDNSFLVWLPAFFVHYSGLFFLCCG